MHRGPLYGAAFVALGVVSLVVEPGPVSVLFLAGGAVFALVPGIPRDGEEPARRWEYAFVAALVGLTAVLGLMAATGRL